MPNARHAGSLSGTVRRHRDNMTRAEFISRQKAIERDLRCLWFIPWGIVFAIGLGMVGWLIYLLVVLFLYFRTDALPTIVCEMGVCLLVLGGLFLRERMWRRSLDKSGLWCPSCGKWLVPNVAETGCCGQCGKRVFDT